MPEADPPTGPTPPGSPARSTAAPERAAPERAPPAPDPDPFEYKDLIIEHIFQNRKGLWITPFHHPEWYS